MNKDKFKEELKSLLSMNSVDIPFLGKWFERTLELLKSVSEQRSGIAHPKHRGNAREVDIQSVFESIFPKALHLRKGFILNSHTTISKEQDIVVTNSDTAGSLIQAGEVSYFPIESSLASIEVKSNLTLFEMRKAILNCISVKKLLYGDAFSNERKEDQKERYCYAIFAYGSKKNLSQTASQINELVADILYHLRPNLVYVLGRGLLIPSHKAGLELKYEQMFYEGDFVPLSSLGTSFIKKSESYAFLWFVTSIIDHCLYERGVRKLPSYFSYVINPICYQSRFERRLKKDHPEQFNGIVENLTDSGTI